jgi:hypothetical protein
MHLISDDEDDTGTDDSKQPHEHMPYEPSSRQEPFTQKANAEYNNEMREENLTDFFTQESSIDTTNIVDDEDEPLAAETPQAELLRWHYRLGHLPFTRLCILALLGTIP